MNVHSRFAPDETEAKEPRERFLWLGYGFYNTTGLCTGRMDAGWVRNPAMLDPIFEAIGLKEKAPARPAYRQ